MQRPPPSFFLHPSIHLLSTFSLPSSNHLLFPLNLLSAPSLFLLFSIILPTIFSLPSSLCPPSLALHPSIYLLVLLYNSYFTRNIKYIFLSDPVALICPGSQFSPSTIMILTFLVLIAIIFNRFLLFRCIW